MIKNNTLLIWTVPGSSWGNPTTECIVTWKLISVIKCYLLKIINLVFLYRVYWINLTTGRQRYFQIVADSIFSLEQLNIPMTVWSVNSIGENFVNTSKSNLMALTGLEQSILLTNKIPRTLLPADQKYERIYHDTQESQALHCTE